MFKKIIFEVLRSNPCWWQSMNIKVILSLYFKITLWINVTCTEKSAFGFHFSGLCSHVWPQHIQSWTHEKTDTLFVCFFGSVKLLQQNSILKLSCINWLHVSVGRMLGWPVRDGNLTRWYHNFKVLTRWWQTFWPHID